MKKLLFLLLFLSISYWGRGQECYKSYNKETLSRKNYDYYYLLMFNKKAYLFFVDKHHKIKEYSFDLDMSKVVAPMYTESHYFKNGQNTLKVGLEDYKEKNGQNYFTTTIVAVINGKKIVEELIAD